jgi:hypothetical protein
VAGLLGVWLLLVTLTPLSAQGEYERLLEDLERAVAGTVERPYSFSGFLEVPPTLVILEYYRNGTGFTPREVEDFVSFVDTSYDTFQRTGNARGLERAQTLAEGVYGRPNPMRQYLYVRASQKEPFDILNCTPALTSIVNLTDGSFNVIPEMVNSPVTNLEVRLRGVSLFGGPGTELGERQNDYRLELRVRYFWGG